MESEEQPSSPFVCLYFNTLSGGSFLENKKENTSSLSPIPVSCILATYFVYTSLFRGLITSRLGSVA